MDKNNKFQDKLKIHLLKQKFAIKKLPQRVLDLKSGTPNLKREHLKKLVSTGNVSPPVPQRSLSPNPICDKHFIEITDSKKSYDDVNKSLILNKIDFPPLLFPKQLLYNVMENGSIIVAGRPDQTYNRIKYTKNLSSGKEFECSFEDKREVCKIEISFMEKKVNTKSSDDVDQQENVSFSSGEDQTSIQSTVSMNQQTNANLTSYVTQQINIETTDCKSQQINAETNDSVDQEVYMQPNTYCLFQNDLTINKKFFESVVSSPSSFNILSKVDEKKNSFDNDIKKPSLTKYMQIHPGFFKKSLDGKNLLPKALIGPATYHFPPACKKFI
ncbi:uncharacterized protein LOC105848113 [Hydra vulgaris]|uniref:uncharacterized protein LOC105848113 n=1 Tax=Hydra vulgaris TaxID=6087 RepID=UPI000640D92A|nr:uncharacterized protein LOC105848113 [Hydra vulgaris]